MPVWAYIPRMARAATTADVFNAIAEPRRRELLDYLLTGERDVTAIVDRLGWPQALVSKHLTVLRSVRLVTVRAEGRRRIYRVNGERLKPIHDWTATYERFWTLQLDRIKQRAEATASRATSTPRIKENDP
jgi:DNA-binding transcriptional ArsR family regulator